MAPLQNESVGRDPSQDCPEIIEGAAVIFSVTLDVIRHLHAPSTRLFAGGKEQTWFHGLAIARYGRDAYDGDVYIFYCNSKWVAENELCFSTIEDAVGEAFRQFGVMRSDWDPVAWPFDQTANTAAISTAPVFRSGRPILFAQHFEDDHSWGFGCGTTHASEDSLLVGMRELLQRDPTIAFISDLPPGKSAERASMDSPWVVRDGLPKSDLR